MDELRHGAPVTRFRVWHGADLVGEGESVVLELAVGDAYRQLRAWISAQDPKPKGG